MFFFYIKKKLNTEYKYQKQFAFSTCTLTEANSPRISRIWSDTSKKNINRHVHVRIKQLGTIKYCRIKKKIQITRRCIMAACFQKYNI